MRFLNVSLIPLVFLAMNSSVSIAAEGHGNVRLEGSIIDTPCAIASESIDQSINLSVLPVSTIVSEGVGPTKPFTITLMNCSLESSQINGSDWSKFSITFEGNTTSNSLFSVSGEASGFGIQIEDSAGNVAIPGQALPASTIVPNKMDLDFNLRLVSNQNPVRAGHYQSAIRFKMDYY